MSNSIFHLICNPLKIKTELLLFFFLLFLWFLVMNVFFYSKSEKKIQSGDKSFK